MTRSDLLRRLLASYGKGDDAGFRTVAEEIIAEDRRKNHQLLARELEYELHRDRHRSGTAPLTLRPIPKGRDDRPLLRLTKPERELDELVLAPDVRSVVDDVVRENLSRATLTSHGLHPRQRLLFVGPPGTGKSVTAHGIAAELSLPVALASLAALTSSFLGDTARNIEAVVRFAEQTPCVLVFDEFDVVGQERSQPGDHGEMRRVAATVLQLLDEARGESVIVATSNHPQLVDSAMWRRFDELVVFDGLEAVVDSGVRASHPLLAPAIADTLAVGRLLPDGADESGHGTMVASLVLHGSLEEPLRSRRPLRPPGWVLSLRVLDRDEKFPDGRVWEEHLAELIELAAQRGARVVNLSVGDNLHPYRPSGPTPVAAVVDGLIREHDLVVVVSAGNVHHENYPAGDRDIIGSYPTWLLGREDTGLLPPAMSALSLTVGALVAGHGQGARPPKESVDVRPMGAAGRPSPLTRIGPGIENMTKPELTAPGGTYVYDLGTDRVRTDGWAGTVLGASARPADRLLARNRGTSFAGARPSRPAW